MYQYILVDIHNTLYRGTFLDSPTQTPGRRLQTSIPPSDVSRTFTSEGRGETKHERRSGTELRRRPWRRQGSGDCPNDRESDPLCTGRDGSRGPSREPKTGFVGKTSVTRVSGTRRVEEIPRRKECRGEGMRRRLQRLTP